MQFVAHLIIKPQALVMSSWSFNAMPWCAHPEHLHIEKKWTGAPYARESKMLEIRLNVSPAKGNFYGGTKSMMMIITFWVTPAVCVKYFCPI